MTRRTFNPTYFRTLMVVAASILLIAGIAIPGRAQSVADLQQQRKQFRLLETQLQKGRGGAHEAIGKYGFNSDQVNAASALVQRNRTEYRQMRRSLVAAGVAVPSPSRIGIREPLAREKRLSPRDRGMVRACGRCLSPGQ